MKKSEQTIRKNTNKSNTLNTLVSLSCGHTSDGQHGIYESLYDTIEPPTNHSWKSLNLFEVFVKYNNEQCCTNTEIMHLVENFVTVFV